LRRPGGLRPCRVKHTRQQQQQQYRVQTRVRQGQAMQSCRRRQSCLKHSYRPFLLASEIIFTHHRRRSSQLANKT
jgi:hypothetical protein